MVPVPRIDPITTPSPFLVSLAATSSRSEFLLMIWCSFHIYRLHTRGSKIPIIGASIVLVIGHMLWGSEANEKFPISNLVKVYLRLALALAPRLGRLYIYFCFYALSLTPLGRLYSAFAFFTYHVPLLWLIPLFTTFLSATRYCSSAHSTRSCECVTYNYCYPLVS